MTFLEKYIFFIFFIKAVFIILAILNLYLKKQIPLEKRENKKTDKIKKQIETQQKIENLKLHIELLFKFLMSMLICKSGNISKVKYKETQTKVQM